MRNQLFEELEASGGLVLPIRPPKVFNSRSKSFPGNLASPERGKQKGPPGGGPCKQSKSFKPHFF